MLISSVLRILGTPEVPRKATKTDPGEKFPEVVPAEPSDEAAAVSTSEVEHQALTAARIVRPLIPDPSVLFAAGANPDFTGYLRALQKQAGKEDAHTLDLFE